jgi:hypothetical protein
VKVLDHPAYSQDLATSDFNFVFPLTETSGGPEISQRQRGEKQTHYLVASETGIQKPIPWLNKLLDVSGDYG